MFAWVQIQLGLREENGVLHHHQNCLTYIEAVEETGVLQEENRFPKENNCILYVPSQRRISRELDSFLLYCTQLVLNDTCVLHPVGDG